MAKWGEGDPRWIVEERPDAKNCNNWHWTEKNATIWSKDRLKDLLEGYEIEQQSGGGMKCSLKVDKIDGEATANNRKGKLIFFYEWNIVLKWSGLLPGNKTEHKGVVTIPNLSEENDLDDIEVTITIEKSNTESELLKTFMYNVGRFKIREILGTYIKELKEEYSKDLILPKKEDGQIKSKPDAVTKISSGFNKKINLSTVNSTPTTKQNSVVQFKKLEFKTSFECRPEDLYNAFTNIDMARAFTGGSVKLNPIVGGEFAFFGENVSGKFLELVPHKKIVQSWRVKQWPTGHYSNVTINIEGTENGTVLQVTQKGVPSDEINKTDENWKRFYCNGIKRAFGFGPIPKLF